MKKRFIHAAILLGFSILSCSVDLPQSKGDGTYTSPDGKATLTVDGNVRILKLSGSNYEMGYNYGYLLGAEIVNVMQDYIFWILDYEDLGYDDAASILDNFTFDEFYLDELEGMLAGIEDALPEEDRTVKPRGEKARSIALDDIRIAHIIADMDCSSFAVWAEGRTDSTLLLARNMDYMHDPDDIVKRFQVIISYDDGTNQRWVSTSICGFTGCLTGMNEDGVCVMMHSTNEYLSSDEDDFIPRGFALRRIVETIGSSNTPADIETMLDTIPAQTGNNFLICFPSLGRESGQVAGIVEYDGDATHPDGRATLRSPSDNPGLPKNSSYDQTLDFTYGIINTNHYLKRNTEIPESGTSSIERYMSIKQNLIEAKSDGNIDLDEAREIIRNVQTGGTIHSVIFEPDAMRLHFFLADPEMSAPDCQRHDYDFEDLFQ
ncbi:hypothetical protein JXM67_14865 [candidate division WOR-3 bacterium]|nr:hypothetical protein [candidate division WOR-3 bacterium]